MDENGDSIESTDNNELEIVILGAAGGGVEVLVYIREMIEAGAKAKVVGMIDDNPSLEGKSFLDVPVLGNTEWALSELSKDIVVVSSIGNTQKKENILKRFEEAGFAFYTVIHPDANLGPDVVVHDGAVIAPGVVITTNVTIGEHSFVNVGTTISHDTVVGPYCTINQGVRVAGSVKLGRGVYLGAGATILHSMEIGDFTVIGACALVNRPVPSRVTAVGIPARVVHSRDGSRPFRGGGRPQRGGDRDRPYGRGGGDRRPYPPRR